MPHHIALSKAKIQLMARPDSAFFTTIVFSLHHIFDETVATACTNGTYIKFNPKFFMDLSPEERVFLLLHEAMHCAYLHMERFRAGADQKCHDRWNIAADHVINLQLIERGFKMPSMGLADYKYKSMSTEEVYKLLPDNPGKPYIQDLEASEVEPEELAREMADILVRAAIQSKANNDAPGTIPGDIQIFLDNLLDPKLPWQRILQKYLQTYAKNDHTWKRPNRRFFPKHHLPSLHSEALLNLAVAVDISGSVSDEEFKQMVSEISSILRMMKPDKITIVQFDTEIKSVNEVRNLQELMAVKFTGRGGTRIGPVLDWAKTTKPQLLMVFTDGGFNFYNDDAGYKGDLIWLIHEHQGWTAPMGKVIHYTM